MSDSIINPPSIESPPHQSTDFDFLELLIVLARHKRLIVGLPLCVAIITTIIAFLMPVTYTGVTRIIPPQSQASSSALLVQQLSSLAGVGGGEAKSPNELYVGMLKSRTVADNLVQRFNLKEVYDDNFHSGTVKRLESATKITPGKDGVIVIEVDDQIADRAAALANAYVEELLKLTKQLAVTEASQRRLFFERQLLEAKDNLSVAETAARQGLERGGLVQVEGQGRALVETTARLRAQITVKEVEISAMRTFAAPGNPELKMAQEEIAALKRELAKVEGTSGQPEGRDQPSNQGKGLNTYNLLRNVKYYETIYELLARQFELAKIDEAKESAVVQIMDKAIVPDKKSKPRRLLMVSMFTAFATLIAVLVAISSDALNRNQSYLERYNLFKRLLRSGG